MVPSTKTSKGGCVEVKCTLCTGNLGLETRNNNYHHYQRCNNPCMTSPHDGKLMQMQPTLGWDSQMGRSKKECCKKIFLSFLY